MAAPPTIVLVHGLWLTDLSWEKWVERYSARGHRVLAPPWPRMDVGIEQLRRDPSPLGGLGLTEIVDHYDRTVRELEAPPILIGHSFGGAVVELLLDRGLGAAGVALSPAPIRGILRLPPAALRSAFPALRNPLNRSRAVGLTPKQFRYSFTNTMTEEAAQAAYDRYHVPGPGRVLFQAAFANLNPRTPAKVDFRNPDRAPLLVVGAELDHTVPASLSREAAQRQGKSPSTTDYKEYPGRSHFLAGEDGWEEIADHALDWATRHAERAPA
jgi:pimeloyl-ACP methyl ester carboxylesterase